METVKKVQAVEHHPRSPDASLERLRALAGIVTIPGPLPSTKFLDDATEGESAAAPGECGRD